MAAIPHSYLMAKSQRKKKAERGPLTPPTDNYQPMDNMNQPLCYNNKMMNSIWGQYNKYSVHNLKAVQNDAICTSNEPLQEMLHENQNKDNVSVNHQESFKTNFGYAGQELQRAGQNMLNTFIGSLRQ